ncbi:MAG: helix-turn-helix domain-containing protein [Actinomycetota bacterium]|nr:helix-turn-helix domain-containing protein [Actinomycetota bacterium]
MERRLCDQARPERAQPMRAEPPKVYTVKEGAGLLKVSQGTVRNMIDEGQLYALRLHVRRIVVPKWAVDDLLARPTAQPNVTPFHRPASNA